MIKQFTLTVALMLSVYTAVISPAVAAEQQHGKHVAPETPSCSAPQTVPSLRCALAPSAVFDRNGRLWVVWAFGGHVYVSQSDDKGLSFSSPVVVNTVPEAISARGENRPKIALDDKGHVYISWTSPLAKRFTGNIRFSRSRNGGKHFDAPVTVNDDRQIITHRFEALSVSADGKVHLAWLDKRDRTRVLAEGGQYRGAALYYTQMNPGEKAFKPNRKIIDNTCECCRVAMALNKDNSPVIMWRHIYGDNIRDHGLVSFVSPEEFGVPVRVSYDQWKIDACPHHGPSLSIDPDNTYHAVWFDNAEKSHGLFYAKSSDRGQSFSVPFSFGNYDQGAAHPYVIAGQNQIYIVWKEFDGKLTRIMSMHSQDNGENWGNPQTVSSTEGASDHPLLVSDNRHAYLSWQTEKEGYRLIKLGPM